VEGLVQSGVKVPEEIHIFGKWTFHDSIRFPMMRVDQFKAVG